MAQNSFLGVEIRDGALDYGVSDGAKDCAVTKAEIA